MKRVYLLRHAKSDWSADYEADRNRPLNRRGREAAELVGRFLAAVGEVPERLLSSPAVRARTTVELAARAGRWERQVQLVDGLYEGGVEAAVAALRELPDSVSSVLLAGHQPTWSSLAGHLAGGGAIAFPTACLVALDLHVASWAHAGHGRGELRWLLPPKLLQAVGWTG